MDKWRDTGKFAIIIVIVGIIVGLFWMISGYKLKETGMFLAKDIEEKETNKMVSVIVMNDVEDKIILSEYIKFSKGETAFDVLNKIADVEFKEYIGIGKFVTSINGLKQTEKIWWLYFVNGNSPKIASDKYELKDGDTIMWRYTSEMPFK